MCMLDGEFISCLAIALPLTSRVGESGEVNSPSPCSMRMTRTFKTIERLSIFFLANHRRLLCMSLDFGVHTCVFFYVRRQGLYVCLCIPGKRSRCGFLLIVNALILCSRVPREGPPPRTVVKTNIADANAFNAVGGRQLVE